MTSHDQLFKDLFRGLFRDLLFLADPDFAGLLAVEPDSGFKFLDKEVFLDVPEGKRREADLVAEVPCRSGGRILVHVEIEHRFSTGMGRRLWRYSHQLHLRYGLPVVSIVVFLRGGPGGAGWIVHTELALDQEIHRFRYLRIVLAKLSAETLLGRSEPLAWALAALARPGSLSRARLKLALLQKTATAMMGNSERFLLVNCIETYLQLAGREAEEYAALRAAQPNPEVEAMRMTWADQVGAQYLQEGIEQGIEQGIEKGRAQGLQRGVERLRNTLVRLLGQRFGEVSPGVRERISAIDSLEELGGLVDRILEIRSIEELGLGS